MGSSLSPNCGTPSQSCLAQSASVRQHTMHPQSNGMIERFHRQLKASLKAQQNPSSWMDSLPLVLLGIRTALKEDIHFTAAEMVYGTSLRLPGEFFVSSPNTTLPDPSSYTSRLKSSMQQIRPSPPHTNTRESHVSDVLSTCTHVFVRHDAVRKPLQPPYDGPYPVLERQSKYFTLDINGHHKTVSVDRLKPAHVDTTPNNSPIPAHAPVPTHAGSHGSGAADFTTAADISSTSGPYPTCDSLRTTCTLALTSGVIRIVRSLGGEYCSGP